MLESYLGVSGKVKQENVGSSYNTPKVARLQPYCSSLVPPLQECCTYHPGGNEWPCASCTGHPERSSRKRGSYGQGEGDSVPVTAWHVRLKMAL